MVATFIGTILAFILVIFCEMWAWNFAIAAVFTFLPTFTFWQMLGLHAFIRLLFCRGNSIKK